MAKNISQELIRAFSRIYKYGKSEISVDTYIRYICIDREKAESLNRNLGIAELMSRLAPPGYQDEWYAAGLLHDIGSLKLPGRGESPQIIAALMQKAGVNSGLIHAVISYRNINDPRRWTALIAALNFADSHTGAGGNLLTTEECCSEGKTGKRCNECMYARYFFSEKGAGGRAEEVILKIREDLKESTSKREKKEEGQDAAKRQRGMEKGSQAADAVHAG